MAKEVLIVDDDRALAKSVARAIESQGYGCRQAHDGNAALSAVAESMPDLILLDMLLPKRDGYGVMQTLKASTATRDIKIIAMSGIYRGRDHAATALKAGALDYLEKPFSASDLTSKLTRHLGRAERLEEVSDSVDRFDLSVTPPAEMIWRSIQDGFSGALHFEEGKRHKILVLEGGTPRFLRSNLAKEALGQRLLRSGRIGERTYNDALRRGKATGRRLGEILIDLGAIRGVELDRVLQEQSIDKLLELFSWCEGESWHQPGIRAVNLASELVAWGPKETILRGVQRMRLEALRSRLDPFAESGVSRAITELDGFEEDPTVVATLKAIDSGGTVRELATEHAAILYGLYLVGGVRFDAPDMRARSSDSPANTNDNLRTELQSMLERIRDQDYFEILGIERTASTADARKAFVRKAKIYHPDKVGGQTDVLQDVAGEIFALMSDAHQTLADEQERERYLHKLETGSLGKDDGSAVKRILSAEALFKKGEELVRGRRYTEALERLQEAVDLDPEEGEIHALYGWAAFLVNREDPGQRSVAVEHLQKAISLAPKSSSGYYYMGLARKACEEQAEAEKMFRKVLELAPDHVEAARELRLIEMRRGKGNKK